MTKISKTKALEMIRQAGGKFFTVIFEKNNGKNRVMNCQYMKDQKENPFGLIKIKEIKLLKSEKEDAWIKSFSINKLKELKINKNHYVINNK